jgi:radical SAM superfamily enzyme YgiQ (UPF0313 family)
MKILVVSPCSEKHMADKYFMSPAPGIVRLAGFLKGKGFDAEWFDPNLQIVTGRGATLEDTLRRTDWDIVGFSCLDETLPTDIQNMYLAHRLRPKALIVAGGIEAQFNYQTILDKTPARIVIIGEGEIPMLMLAQGKPWQDIPGIVIKNAAQPLSQELFNEVTLSIPWEELPYEAYWDHYVAKYGAKMTPTNEQEIHTVRVFSRNRCPIGCKFCSSTNQLTWGSGETVPVLSATEDNLIEIVKRVRKGHPRVKTVYLTDDDFVINKRSVVRFCQKVVEEDFGDLTFMCFARATDLNREVLTWMKRANFRRLVIGVESFSQPVLDDMNKRCDAEEIHSALELCKEIGIKPHINIILVTPKATLRDIEISIDCTLYYLKQDYVYAGVISAIRPLKGTDYHEEYANYLTQVVPIPGTKYHLKIDDMIWAEDPHVREVQEQYWNGIDAEVFRQVETAGIVHPTGDNVAEFSLMFMRKLIRDVRRKYGLPAPHVPEVERFRLPEIERAFDAYIEERSEVAYLPDRLANPNALNRAQKSVVYK